MRRLCLIGLIAAIFSLPVYRFSIAADDEERYITVEIKDPVTGKVEYKNVPESIFIERVPKSRGEQVFDETIKGAGTGAAVGAVEGAVVGGPVGIPAGAVGGAMVGAAQGAAIGATEPTEYRTYDKTEINEGLKNTWSDTEPRY